MENLTINNLREKISELFLENKYDIVSVGISAKVKNGVLQDKKCISFGVKSKLPLEEIPADKLIPKQLTIDGVLYETDVIEAPEKFYANPDYCYDTGSNTVPPIVGFPVSGFRSKSRPLSGGISGAAPPASGFVNAGTMGGIVIDLNDNKLVGITNNHVGGTPGGISTQKNTPYTLASDASYGGQSANYKNINFYQPSSWDSGAVTNTPDLIGPAKRCYPFFTQPSLNKIDVALINLSAANLIGSNSFLPLSAPFSTPCKFATTSEINSISINDPVYKAGRTTGPIGGRGSCNIKITSVSLNTNVGYTPFTISFTDCLRMESSTNSVVGSGGDSGGLIYCCINSTNPSTSAWRIVGVNFAGSSDGSLGIANRIDNVATLFSVSAWEGEPRSNTPSLCSYIYLPRSTFGSSITALSAGKVYWQVGIV